MQNFGYIVILTLILIGVTDDFDREPILFSLDPKDTF